MSTTVDFVKGHCGWDVVTLVPEGQVPPGLEVEAALKILRAPVDGGLEVGFIARARRPGDFELRMVSSTAGSWISMCGGMSQVIGKALVETALRDRFQIDISGPSLAIRLLTASGDMPVNVEIRNGKARSVRTIMDGYLQYLYRLGVEQGLLEDVCVWRVGEYVVIDVASLEGVHPGIDFTRRDPGPHLDIVNAILKAFAKQQGSASSVGMLFDNRAAGAGSHRVFPRFYSEDLAAARIPWEFQCGTGSCAVVTLLAHLGRLPFTANEGEIVLEWGNVSVTPDPYGVRTSRFQLGLDGRRVLKCTFSHSVVEILAEGRLSLPNY